MRKESKKKEGGMPRPRSQIASSQPNTGGSKKVKYTERKVKIPVAKGR